LESLRDAGLVTSEANGQKGSPFVWRVTERGALPAKSAPTADPAYVRY
jgi:hypothetical protein